MAITGNEIYVNQGRQKVRNLFSRVIQSGFLKDLVFLFRHTVVLKISVATIFCLKKSFQLIVYCLYVEVVF